MADTITTVNTDEIVPKREWVSRMRYSRSFLAKLILSEDRIKEYYAVLTNALLAFEKTRVSKSRSGDGFYRGRAAYARLAISGKTLCLYLALDPDKVDGKYKVEKIDSQKYAAVPCLYRIINDRRVKYAMELITVACERLELKKREVPLKDYVMPYETIEELLEKGSIKEKQLTATERLKREKAFDRTKNKSGAA